LIDIGSQAKAQGSLPMAEVSSVEDYAPFCGWRTWYRITGDLSSPKPPVFILHGGPGAAHHYLDRYIL
jgi:L-proline amide hydrolase